MALTLGIPEGGKFYVGDDAVTLAKIVSDEHFVLEVRGKAFDVTGDRGVEILPDVVISAGNHPEWVREVQVVISAPRSIRILREALYLKEASQVRGSDGVRD